MSKILDPATVPPRTGSNYPGALKERVAGRAKRVLGDPLGIKNFGVNLTTLKPGVWSALRHHHARQDEFVYIVAGHPTLVTDAGRTKLSPGLCAGFPAGDGDGHCLINETDADVVYLEVGDRTPGDAVVYPDEDLIAKSASSWTFTRKDGSAV
ncbi:MAG: cupin domain-containing protein [Tagaea sp.]|nr:cupin domain-containing protein [Tagaea sp.]